jgi:ABC-type Fe3+ transport system substrate-binding protein
MLYKSVLSCTAAFAFALLPSVVSAETMDELYAKAKPEKSLVVYAGGPVAGYEPLARDFEKQFPGLSVSITGGFSNVLNEKIEQQLKANKLEVDLALFQTAQDFVRWKKQGSLLLFKPEGAETIPAAFRDPDGAFYMWFVVTLGYAYNTQHVKPENAPKSALDFLKPEFKGKMIACYPFDDDATLYLFYTLMQKYGDDYLDKYLANEPNWIQGHLGVARSVGAGTDYVTLDASTASFLNVRKSGQPIQHVFSDIDPIPVFYSTAGIFKDAPHSNVAKLFLTWLLQPEQQKRIGTYSPRPDIAPPSADMRPLSEMKIANNYLEFITNEDLLAKLRKRFLDAIGPIKNTGGIR